MPRIQPRPRADESEDDEMNQADDTQNGGGSDQDASMEDGYGGMEDETSQLIKKLVRYALACEFSRTPIRRDGIREKGRGLTDYFTFSRSSQ